MPPPKNPKLQKLYEAAKRMARAKRNKETLAKLLEAWPRKKQTPPLDPEPAAKPDQEATGPVSPC
jgi:hypothetical protein